VLTRWTIRSISHIIKIFELACIFLLRYALLCLICKFSASLWCDKHSKDLAVMATKKSQSFIGKVFTLTEHQVVVEDLIAEGTHSQLNGSFQCTFQYILRSHTRFWYYSYFVHNVKLKHNLWVLIFFSRRLCFCFSCEIHSQWRSIRLEASVCQQQTGSRCLQKRTQHFSNVQVVSYLINCMLDSACLESN
jgi:hypothetical protein